MDGGSTDSSLNIIEKYADKLSGWRTRADEGQSSAINEGMALGTAPYVCWLNSDDWFLPDGLDRLVRHLDAQPNAPAVYGKAWNVVEQSAERRPVWVEPFRERRLAVRCIISQPATLIRRSAWEMVNGLDERLDMVMDYDLWWRLFRQCGPLHFYADFVAVNRDHHGTKTQRHRAKHYREAIAVVQQHYGTVPIKWWLAQPYAVWFKSIRNWLR